MKFTEYLTESKENKNVLLIGTIENDVCKFEIPKLSISKSIPIKTRIIKNIVVVF